MRLLRPFLFYRMDAMRKSSDFSVSTLKQLNGATFAELDAAETRLAGWDYHLAYLKRNMTQEQRDAITLFEQYAKAAEREAAK